MQTEVNYASYLSGVAARGRDDGLLRVRGSQMGARDRAFPLFWPGTSVLRPKEEVRGAVHAGAASKQPSNQNSRRVPRPDVVVTPGAPNTRMRIMPFPSFAFSEQEQSAKAPLTSARIRRGPVQNSRFATPGERLQQRVHGPGPAELHGALSSGACRYDEGRPPAALPPTITGRFSDPYFATIRFFFPLIQRLLGEDCVLGACGIRGFFSRFPTTVHPSRLGVPVFELRTRRPAAELCAHCLDSAGGCQPGNRFKLAWWPAPIGNLRSTWV